MSRIVVLFLVALWMPALAVGQSSQGYVFYAPSQIRWSGGSEFFHHFGGGGKYISTSGLGLASRRSMTRWRSGA